MTGKTVNIWWCLQPILGSIVFLVDLPRGRRCSVNYKRPYIEDVSPNSDANMCLFHCILKKLRPMDNEEDMELRVQLMWRIFTASKFQEVKSDSVIKDHRQVIIEDDLDYILTEIVDYNDLLNQQLPPTNQWAATAIQDAINV